MKIKKRDGRIVEFNPAKIDQALKKCVEGMEFNLDTERMTLIIVDKINQTFVRKRPSVEQIQDVVEMELMNVCPQIAKKFMSYRQERTMEREKNTVLNHIIDSIFYSPAEENDLKRDNANTNTDAPMGSMLKIGSEASKQYYINKVLDPKYATPYLEGLIHIHDIDFYNLTTTCCQIDLEKLLSKGFSTGTGSIRPPKSIRAAMALVAIVLQSNQNDQHELNRAFM